jgi:2-C-methyl-D-erythritol 4-phosphate cytidylyltransferase
VKIAGDLVKAARARGAAAPVTPLADAVKRIEGDTVIETPRRLGLVRAQTPQAFQTDILIAAYEYALATGGLPSGGDDAALVEAHGGEVAAVLGEEYNIQLTTPRDFRLAEALLAAGLLD